MACHLLSTWAITWTNNDPMKSIWQINKILTKHTLISTPAGTTIGRNESECGQMGVMRMAGTLGWIMEAPAAAE